jgi:hypothetical protein
MLKSYGKFQDAFQLCMKPESFFKVTKIVVLVILYILATPIVLLWDGYDIWTTDKAIWAISIPRNAWYRYYMGRLDLGSGFLQPTLKCVFLFFDYILYVLKMRKLIYVSTAFVGKASLVSLYSYTWKNCSILILVRWSRVLHNRCLFDHLSDYCTFFH